MIILRQHNYTFADRKVIDEVLKATKKLSDLPEGWRNLTTRDIYRLEDLSNAIYHKKSINEADLKELATHLGLPETAKHGKRFIEKYNNPELIERWKRVQIHKKGLKNKLKEYKELKDIEDAYWNDMWNRDKELKYQRTHPRKRDLENELTVNPKKPLFSEEFIGQKEQLDKIDGYKGDNLNDKELIRRLREDQKKRGVKIRPGRRSTAMIGLNRIELKPNHMTKSPTINFHEDGHLVWEDRSAKRLGFPDLKSSVEYKGMRGVFIPDNPLSIATREAGANVAGLSKAKRLGASKKELARIKENMADAYKTYIPRFTDSLPGNMSNVKLYE